MRNQGVVKKYQEGWKGKEKGKGKWNLKGPRPQDAGQKENISPYKKFNGPQLREKT